MNGTAAVCGLQKPAAPATLVAWSTVLAARILNSEQPGQIETSLLAHIAQFDTDGSAVTDWMVCS